MALALCGIIGLGTICAACGSQDALTAPVRPEEAEAEPTASLCWYANLPSKETRDVAIDELIRRGAVRSDNLRAIEERNVVVGMNDCETIAAWGEPDRYDDAPPVEFDKLYEYGNRGTVGFDKSGHVVKILRAL